MIPIKFERGVKLYPKGITSRRIKAAERALIKQQQRYPLLKHWIKAQQPSPSERIAQADAHTVALFSRLRNHDAKCWREQRQTLRRFPLVIREQLIQKWNNAKLPKTGTYFADFIRTQLKKITFVYQEEKSMLSLFTDYLTNLESEIAQYEEKLEEKKQEAERLNGLQSQVGQALDTLKTVVNSIRDIDAQAMTILKEAALSLFQQTSREEKTTPSPYDSDNTQGLKSEKIQQPGENPIKQSVETAKETIPEIIEKSIIHNDEESEQYLSEQVLYIPHSQTTLFGFQNKSAAQRLQTFLKPKFVGCSRKIRKATKLQTKWEFIMIGLSLEEAQYLTENLGDYLEEEEREQHLSGQVIYAPHTQTTFIGFNNQNAAQRLQTAFKHKQVGEAQEIRKGTKFSTSWELVVKGLDKEEAEYLAENLGHYFEDENQIEENKEQKLSEQIIYVPQTQTAFIGLNNQNAAECLKTFLQQKPIGHSQEIRKGTKLKTPWELVVKGISSEEVRQNLGHYVQEAEKPSSTPKKTPQTGLCRNQRVKVMSSKAREFIGQIGKIVTKHDDSGAYVEFDNGATKFFWENQLQPV